jgi:hypothetical protein
MNVNYTYLTVTALKYIIKGLICLMFCVNISYAQSSERGVSFNDPDELVNGIGYQAVLRDKDGKIIQNESVHIELKLYSGEDSRIPIYDEVHSVTTNMFGIINVIFGLGESSDDFFTIDWRLGPFYLEVVIEGDVFEKVKLKTVPTALYAQKSYTFITGEYSKLSNEPDPDAFVDTTELKDLKGFIPKYPELPSTSFKGRLIYNEADSLLYTYDGVTWNKVGGNIEPPKKLSEILTINNSASNRQISNLSEPVDETDVATKNYVDVQVSFGSGKKYSGTTPPENPALGDIYYNTDDKLLYYFVDPEWIVVGSGGVLLSEMLGASESADNNPIKDLGNPSGLQDLANKFYVDKSIQLSSNAMPAHDTHPETPILGSIYYNTLDKVHYYYNGTDWMRVGGEIPTIGSILTLDNDAGGNQIKELAIPVNDNDIATLEYLNNRRDNIDGSVVTSETNPATGSLGDIFYDIDDKVIKYCSSVGTPPTWLPIVPVNKTFQEILSLNNSAGGNKISNLATPTADTHISNKSYVDTRAESVGSVVYSSQTPPPSPSLGQIYLNLNDNNLYYYNGSSWNPVINSNVSSLSALLASGNDANNKNISDLADPEVDSDIATLGFALQVISGEYSEEKQLIFTIGYDGSWNSEVIPLWKTPLGKRVDILEVSAYTIGEDTPELKYKLELRPESSLSESGSNLFDYSIANQEGDERTSFTGGTGVLGENHLVLVTSTTGALVSGFVNSLTLVIVYKERY